MYFLVSIAVSIFALNLLKESLSAGNPEPISLHAEVFDETTGGSTSQQAPKKISTGRMKPISGSGSPRMHEAYTDLSKKGNKHIKGFSNTAIMGNPLSPHSYPKITIRPGKKDISVVSQFHHPQRPSANSKPFEYMYNQQKDIHEDVTRPASKYKLGLRKIDDKSEEFKQVKEDAYENSKNHHHPKAALIQTLKGDPRASSKHPTIDVNQGKLHGNLVIAAYGPESPPKQKTQTHPTNLASQSHQHNPRPRSRSPENRISSPSSPRYQEALRDIHGAFRHTVKAVSHTAVLPDPTTHHQYPKVSVKPGRQDSNVVSFFHHPAEHTKGGQPYQYMQHTKLEELSDVHQPAKRYRIGQQKANVHSEETAHVANMITEMHSAGWNQPKAALVHSLPGDARAKSKRPTVNANPGRLYGNLVTVVYGPPSPTTKKGKETQRARSPPSSDRGESSKRARVQQ